MDFVSLHTRKLGLPSHVHLWNPRSRPTMVEDLLTALVVHTLSGVPEFGRPTLT